MTGLQNSRNPLLADFDWRLFAQAIKTRCVADGRAQWVIAKDIGITESDLSRVRGGQIVSVAKAVALARWLGQPLETWYLAPLPDPAPELIKSTSCSGSNVKQLSASRAEGAPSGPRKGSDARSSLPPQAGCPIYMKRGVEQ